jgi:SAM-dependent methyltransferase
MNNEILGPFGNAERILGLPTAYVNEMYRAKCGVDVTPHFGGVQQIDLYQCKLTGYRFWRPESVSGNELFYKQLSVAWKHYYRDWRWEYGLMRSVIRKSDRLLEVGCGRGYFLKSIELRVQGSCGLEFNSEAVANKVTSREIKVSPVEEYRRTNRDSFDVVCSFQVLEHVVDPASFIEGCIDCLKPGGLLAFSTPNSVYVPHAERRDAFDLPPHHMGHFSREVFEHLARLYSLEIHSIFEQPRYCEFEAVTKRTARSLAFRLSVRASKMLFNGVYRIVGEPGAGILVIFRKRAKSPFGSS